MPKGKSGNHDPAEPLSAHDKIARLLGILAVKDQTDPVERVVLLQGAGFGITEIVSMLGTTRNAIDLINYRRRKKKSSKTTKKH